MIILDLIAIAVIVAYVVDLSNFLTTVKKMIWKWLKPNKPYQDFNLKPFDCSLCMSHHCMVIYLLCTGNFSIIMWMVVCLISFFTKHISDILETISDTLIKITNKINNIL